MHPYIHAQKNPDKPAYIMAGSGETVTYRQLDEQSNRIAQLFRALGPQAGRPHRPLPREQSALLRDLLGRPALGPDLHRDQLAADRGRGRLHRDRLRRQAVRHLEVPRRQGGRTRRLHEGRHEPLHDRRHDDDGYGLSVWEAAVAASRRPASPTRPRATTCSIRRAPPAGPRACCRSSSRSRSTTTIRCCRSAASSTASTRTRSISRRRRSITRLPCAST